MANVQVFHSFSPTQYIRLTGGVQDVPYDYYLTPGSAALAASGPGQTAERPNRTWHGDAQWNWSISPGQELVVGAEARHDQSTITEYNLSNWAIRDSHIEHGDLWQGQGPHAGRVCGVQAFSHSSAPRDGGRPPGLLEGLRRVEHPGSQCHANRLPGADRRLALGQTCGGVRPGRRLVSARKRRHRVPESHGV